LEAVGVNPVDTYLRQGANNYTVAFPWTPGLAGAGTVEVVGEGVARVKAGDRVFLAGSLTGTYAAAALCAEAQVWPLPPAVSFEQGACLGVPALTALRALTDIGQALPGEAVLVHGASGGVGLAAVQLGKAMGLKVAGTASTREGRDLVLAQGADAAFDHGDGAHLEQAAAWAGGGVPLVLEMLANVNLGADLKWLAKGGRVVVIGSRGEVAVNPRDLMARDASIRGMSVANIPPDRRAQLCAELADRLAKGELRPQVAQTFPLEGAGRAHEAVMAPGARGHIVMKP
jgi:NADPH2:quinone reductase